MAASVSALVEEEISAGDQFAAQRRLEAVENIPSVAITSHAQELAHLLISAGAVPDTSSEDALHIGIATSQGIEL